ncbi:MAG: DUF4129 domain-containing protein [Bacteroides sp.]|nr:DUF4129 domain-containing protein [Bacteroides sp.]
MTVPSDTLVCDTTLLAAWRADDAFLYDRELLMPEVNIFQWLSRWVSEWLHRIFGSQSASEYSDFLLIGAVILLLLLLCWFIYRKHPGLFVRSRKDALPYTVAEDSIYGIDFEQSISEALARTDYREAVRLVYLQTLRRLSDAGRIDWQLYKTPTQYMYELRLPAFRSLTQHFLKVRYGNFVATEALYREMRTLQEQVQKGGDA